MIIDFNGFDKGVIGKKLPSDTTLNNMKKAELIELLHIAQHNHETLAFFYKNAVDNSKCHRCLLPAKWIPCSEKYPDHAGFNCLVTAKNIFDQYDVFIAFTGYGDFKWHCNDKEHTMDNWDVIAWQPLPEPYKAGDEDE